MHGDAFAQAGGETRGEGLYQADFRHEQQYLAAVLGQALYPADVDFGFAGAGDAIEQRRLKAAGGQGGEDGFLRGVERRRGGGCGGKSLPMGARGNPATFFQIAQPACIAMVRGA